MPAVLVVPPAVFVANNFVRPMMPDRTILLPHKKGVKSALASDEVREGATVPPR